MALSNWFFVGWSIDSDWKVTPLKNIPKIETEEGLIIEICKNWIYVYPKEREDEGITIYSGYVSGYGFEIMAKRGLQNSLYAVIKWYKDDGWGLLLAVAGDGSDKRGRWVGCRPRTLKCFKKFAAKAVNELCFVDKLPELIPAICFNQGDLYFSERLGLPMQYHKVGEKAPKPYLLQMFEGCKKSRRREGKK